MSTPNLYSSTAESDRPATNGPGHGPPDSNANTAAHKLSRSFWLSYSLIASGVAGAVAIGLILWGDRANQIDLVWAGSILFAITIVVWLILVGLLTLWVFLDVVRTISGLVKSHKILGRLRIRQPRIEQHGTDDTKGDHEP